MMGNFSDRERLRYRLETGMKRAIRDYELISEGDHLLVGLSGGKDSLALVQLLGDMSKKFRPNFKVSALHVQMKEITYQSDLAFLKQHCEVHGVEFHTVISSLKNSSVRQEELFAQSSGVKSDEKTAGKEKQPCFLCSWNRRKALFETAQALNCTKIALGHHRDDFLETLMLNMFFQGSIQSIAPKLRMDKFPVEVIRPLCMISEKDLESFAALEGYPSQQRNCPYGRDTRRSEVRDLIEELEQKHPGLKDSLWASMKHIYTRYLP